MTPSADTVDLSRQLGELGLPPYQARVLVALLVAGSANSAELAELSGVYRTSIYKAVDALTEKGLVELVPTHGAAVWTCHGWSSVLDVLDAAARERCHLHRARIGRLREALANMLPEKRSVSV